MAKAKLTPVQEEKLITLTKEQFQKLMEVREMLDNITDALDDIEGDENLYEIGKQVGAACAEAIDAYNKLSEVVMDNNEDDSPEYDSAGFTEDDRIVNGQYRVISNEAADEDAKLSWYEQNKERILAEDQLRHDMQFKSSYAKHGNY